MTFIRRQKTFEQFIRFVAPYVHIFIETNLNSFPVNYYSFMKNTALPRTYSADGVPTE